MKLTLPVLAQYLMWWCHFMDKQKVLIIGEVYVDMHLDIKQDNEPVLRLGGIFHAARAFSALETDFALAYYSPNYLDSEIEEWSLYLLSKGAYKLGNIDRAPNVMLVNESTEAGDQGYINILKDQAIYTNTNSLEIIISEVNPTDVLLFPGRYDLKGIMDVLNTYSGKLHIDIQYDSDDLFKYIKRDISSLILSTSSSIFHNECHGSYSEFFENYKSFTVEKFLVKENRGGSICYDSSTQKLVETSAYYIPTMHSVGVGDVYNAVFIYDFFRNIKTKMKIAALCAAKYAETLDFKRFNEDVKNIINNPDDFITLKGIRIGWENRKKINIYMAAPDFPDVNTELLDNLSASLEYHNFSVRRPIQENGLATNDLSPPEEIEMYNKDLNLLNECDLLIAVMLYNDPGTLIELGMFRQSEKPTIVFDPYYNCKNMFFKHTPNYICHTISDVIGATYLCVGGEKDE